MSVTVTKPNGALTMRLTAYHDCDNVQLCWRIFQGEEIALPLPACLGFKIERQRKDEDGNWMATEILRNRVGFDPDPPVDQDGIYRTEPSSIWPFQRFDWTDHGANNGETVRYRICAMTLPPDAPSPGSVELTEIADTDWSPPIQVEAYAGDGVYAYFNRGAVMSQYVARIARKNQWGANEIKDHIKDFQEPLRRFLSGELRVALLGLLDEAIADMDTEIHAALYELSDEELIERLLLLRGRAHVILANGSDKQGDGNATAREKLKSGGVDVYDRLLKNQGLGHNKFVVLSNNHGQNPLKVCTGSTNWAATGLCTQLNNGILIKDPAMAGHYREHWKRLQEAGSSFPSSLVEANANSPYISGNTGAWFTRVRNKSVHNVGLGADIQTLVDLVNNAQECILYVMFQPGTEPLQSILLRAQNIYARGVVSTVTANNNEAFTLKGVGPGTKAYETALIQPEGIAKTFSVWVEEVTRSQFLFPPENPGIGHAITHAKMIVIDPFSANCKVVTGSHNFSISASEQNDDNFVVISGNQKLAEAYAVACMATYAHYRWRAYVAEQAAAGKTIWDHLDSDDTWQSRNLTAAQKLHLKLWCP